jgi:peptidoglycan hydrolase-like protein with peptidoglycan-binding domain
VQVELRDRFRHPTLKADGIYGEKTEQVVRGFQEKRQKAPWKLPVNGKVGKRTWLAIFA